MFKYFVLRLLDLIPGMDAELMTLPIRLIRSFEYRNIQVLVLKACEKSWTVEKLMETVREGEALCSVFTM